MPTAIQFLRTSTENLRPDPILPQLVQKGDVSLSVHPLHVGAHFTRKVLNREPTSPVSPRTMATDYTSSK